MVEIIVKFTLRVTHAVQVSLSHLVYLDELAEKVTLPLIHVKFAS